MSLSINRFGLKRFKLKYLLYFIIYFAFCFQFLNNVFGFPTIFRYLIDAAIIILIIASSRYKGCRIKEIRPLKYWLYFYIIYLIVSYFINYQSLAYLIWGLKNNLRFILFFYLCVRFFDEDDVNKIYRLIDKLFYINFSLVLIEYLVFGLRGDLLGGLFGTEKGSNGYLNIYLVVYITITAVRYIETKNESLYKLIIKLGIIASISALCELKVVFFELLIIIMAAVFSSGFSVKKILIIGLSLVAMYIAYIYMIGLFQYSVNVFSREGFINYTFQSGYTLRSNEFNRLNFISVANNYFLKTPLHRAIGLGVGNCDTSNIQIFYTPFADMYTNTHYSWFMTAFTYLEQGMIGLVIYVMFFIINIANTFKKKCLPGGTNTKIARIIGIMTIIIIFYNQSMRQDMAFLLYFMLAVPYILKKHHQRTIVK